VSEPATWDGTLTGWDIPRFTEPALCAEIDPELWYPFASGNASAKSAKAVCRRCPARLECLAWALEHHEEYGVWGGTTVKDRARLRRRGQVAA
jgi:WhiB family transcriptional regulator, redox-sensing transcriptional regulator